MVLLTSKETESYDGVAWSVGGDMSQLRYNLAGCGSWSSALSFGGNALGNATDMTEKYS
jgi:hypothetical protein